MMTQTIKEQILAVRDTGETNMFDVNAVQYIANREGYYELVVYLMDNRKEYSNFIMTGTAPGLEDDDEMQLKKRRKGDISMMLDFNNDKAKAMVTKIKGWYDEGLIKTKGTIESNSYTSTSALYRAIFLLQE